MALSPSATARAIPFSPYAVGYLVLLAALLAAMAVLEGFSPALPLFVLVFIGVGFSGMTLLATRRHEALPFVVRRPGLETLALGIYLVGVVGGYLVWAMPRLGPTFEPGTAANLTAILVKKLVLFAVVPFLLFRFVWGYRLRELADPSLRWSRTSSRRFGSRSSPYPSRCSWAEAFARSGKRASRRGALLRSEAGGLFVMAVLFGLTHAPGLYMRSGGSIEALGASPSVLVATGYSIVVISVVSLFLGVLWILTRNLPMLMIVHAAFDWIPKIPEVVKALLR